MGMALAIRKVSADKLAALQAHPAQIIHFLTGIDEADFASLSLLDRLLISLGLKAAPQPPANTEWQEPGEDEETDLDKAWHGLHYLLTGQAEGGAPPASYLLTGTPIGDIEVGYGPATALAPAQVQAFATHLQSLTPDDLAARYNPEDMTAQDIYPNIWVPLSEDAEPLDYLLENYRNLRDFTASAAQEQAGLILWLT